MAMACLGSAEVGVEAVLQKATGAISRTEAAHDRFSPSSSAGRFQPDEG